MGKCSRDKGDAAVEDCSLFRTWIDGRRKVRRCGRARRRKIRWKRDGYRKVWILGGRGGERGKRKNSRCEPWDKEDNKFLDALRILGAKGGICELGGHKTYLYSNPARWWGISYDMKDKIADILIIIR